MENNITELEKDKIKLETLRKEVAKINNKIVELVIRINEKELKQETPKISDKEHFNFLRDGIKTGKIRMIKHQTIEFRRAK